MLPTITLFHATCAPDLETFDVSRSIGCGSDANSALGVHFSERPEDTLAYVTDEDGMALDSHARVVLAECELSRVLLVSSSNDFFGIDECGNQILKAEAFASARLDLIAQGYDAVCIEGDIFDGGGAGVWVVLDPSKLRITGTMSLDEASDSDCRSNYEGIELVPGTIFADEVWNALGDQPGGP